MVRTIFYILLFCSILSANLFLTAKSVSAAIPQFPSCVNPQGIVKSNYDSGTHGVPGNLAEFHGKDVVYTVSDALLLQCLCTDDGSGIQTNWIKTSILTSAEIQELKNEGWIFIPNGSLWGLEETSYLAQNISYTCQSSGGNGGNSNGGSNNSSNTGTGGTGGSVLAAVTNLPEVLASTGNILTVYVLIAVGIITFILSWYLSGKKPSGKK